jgi:DNA-binding CsgD family transcriptional regulator
VPRMRSSNAMQGESAPRSERPMPPLRSLANSGWPEHGRRASPITRSAKPCWRVVVRATPSASWNGPWLSARPPIPSRHRLLADRAGTGARRARGAAASGIGACGRPAAAERIHARGPAAGDGEEGHAGACSRARARRQETVETPSRAELSILQLLASDLSQREIGSELFLSLNTVKSHSRHLYAKLGVHSRAEAIEKAYLLGLVESPAVLSATRPASR